LGLLEQEKIALVFSLEMTQQLLKPYVEKPVVEKPVVEKSTVLDEPLSLPISEQSAA
jgi:hypothetical protein